MREVWVETKEHREIIGDWIEKRGLYGFRKSQVACVAAVRQKGRGLAGWMGFGE
jgi:hypothetical protein